MITIENTLSTFLTNSTIAALAGHSIFSYKLSQAPVRHHQPSFFVNHADGVFIRGRAGHFVSLSNNKGCLLETGRPPTGSLALGRTASITVLVELLGRESGCVIRSYRVQL